MILSLVSIFFKLAILWVVIWLGKNFLLFHNVAYMIRVNRPAANGESKACDSVLEIGHIFGHIWVRRKFHSKSSKTALWWYVAKHFPKTMIPRRSTVFCKLVIVYFVMGLNKNFKVRVLKRWFHETNRRTRWIRRLKGVWQYLAYWSSFWS